ncbi:hypothetical protein pdam_00012691 [Pocillopora damicornis]|uniref:Uncharacterized protein n=1 Tax=Pocillopora damicornis TaxID=46731 RepID=A0A3M6UMU1_POCDA|nr:hypothetical protein pdam_00012691 [Pocillopora damicornis]
MKSTSREWYYHPVDEFIFQEYSDRRDTELIFDSGFNPRSFLGRIYLCLLLQLINESTIREYSLLFATSRTIRDYSRYSRQFARPTPLCWQPGRELFVKL